MPLRRAWQAVAALTLCGTLGCTQPPAARPGADVERAAALIAPDALLRHIATLSSTEFEGRAPGTRGETLTVDYLVGELRRLGLAPGNPDGRYVQDVPIVATVSEPRATLEHRGRRSEWTLGRDYVGGCTGAGPDVAVRDAELVFAGYGVVAPEADWDDYKDADVRGRALLRLMNDPQLPVADGAEALDEAQFRGEIKTWYATGRHKTRVAAERGAVLGLGIHETRHAGWPFHVALANIGRETLELEQLAEPRLPAHALLPFERAAALLREAGFELEALRRRAQRRDFRPVPLDMRLSIECRQRERRFLSRNVAARIEGSDPALRHEAVLYTAHWDHLGRDPKLPGDGVYHGALDNASGTAALLEIARAWQALPVKPARSVLFLFTTAEEAGLLGAKHYAAHPLVPHARTLAAFNIDVTGAWGRTRDFEVVGLGETTLDATLHAVAARQGKLVKPDGRPDLGLAYRQDSLELKLAGVPAVFLRRGDDDLDRPPGHGRAMSEAYMANDYHRVTDTVKPDWDLRGAAELARFAFAAGHAVASGGAFPEWLPGSEFKAAREASLRAAAAAR